MMQFSDQSVSGKINKDIGCDKMIRCDIVAIFVWGLPWLNDESRTCFCGYLSGRQCTQALHGERLHLGREALISKMVLIISPWVINAECFDLREVPLCQAVGIRKEVAPCFTTLLQILNFDKAGQAAFLTAPTVVILLKSMLSVMLHKYSYCRSGISTRAIPSMDWISLLPRFRVVRAGKLIWAISFTPVALLSTISAITYRSQALSLPIDWWTVAEGRLLPSTFENLNEIALTYFHNPFLLQRFSLRNHNLLSSYFYFSAAFIIFFSVFKANRMKDHLHILKSFMLAKLFFENIKLKK